MALQIEFKDGSGVIHPEAYARIQKVIIENKPNGDKNVCSEVCIYASQFTHDAGKSPVWGPQAFQVEKPAKVQPKEGAVVMECAVDPDIVTVTDCYNWLKTQDKFAEAQDV